jgi:hypothetical protein
MTIHRDDDWYCHIQLKSKPPKPINRGRERELKKREKDIVALELLCKKKRLKARDRLDEGLETS